jgi:hypothetical protein
VRLLFATHRTFRIRTPGVYRLGEDISFNPNSRFAGGNGAPTEEQFVAGLYSRRAYGLGFFAAITIECSDVDLDLAGHKLEQSVEHALTQRFFSLIELADAPFHYAQGECHLHHTYATTTTAITITTTMTTITASPPTSPPPSPLLLRSPAAAAAIFNIAKLYVVLTYNSFRSTQLHKHEPPVCLPCDSSQWHAWSLVAPEHSWQQRDRHRVGQPYDERF